MFWKMEALLSTGKFPEKVFAQLGIDLLQQLQSLHSICGQQRLNHKQSNSIYRKQRLLSASIHEFLVCENASDTLYLCTYTNVQQRLNHKQSNSIYGKQRLSASWHEFLVCENISDTLYLYSYMYNREMLTPAYMDWLFVWQLFGYSVLDKSNH